MERRPSWLRRPGFWILLAMGIVMLAGACLVLMWPGTVWFCPPGKPYVVSYARPVGPVFSPDGNTVAYTWREGTVRVVPTMRAPLSYTLTESVSVHWFPVGQTDQERQIALDSVDLRPDGVLNYRIGVQVRFSPDSKRFAAVHPSGITIIDLETGAPVQWKLAKGHFASVAWTGDDEIAYATWQEGRSAFWRRRIDVPPTEAELIYEEAWDYAKPQGKALPFLANHHWSPDGKAVLFTSRVIEGKNQVLLNMESGEVTPLLAYLSEHHWRPDGGAVLVVGPEGPGGSLDDWPTLLVNARTGEVTDLTEEIAKAVGSPDYVRLADPCWTADGKYIVLNKSFRAGGSSPATYKHTGYVIQPQPWKVILSIDGRFPHAAAPGWILHRPGDSYACRWLSYDGVTTAPADDWSEDWIWSPDGRRVAKVESKRIVIIEPKLPPAAAP